MGNSPDIISVVFDFDDTLAPDSTTKLLREHGMDTDRFWRTDVAQLVEHGYDPALAWLNLVLENIGPGKPLGQLTNQHLREFGATLDADFFPGLPQLFDDFRAQVRTFKDIGIELYIITGGLQEVIEGSQVVQKHFAAVYGSRLAGNGEDQTLRRIRRCVTFTEKTRYLFEINKGLDPSRTAKNPFLVNEDIPQAKRRVPFRNTIYVGDGLTDIPCFSLLKQSGGYPFGVFDPSEPEKAKRALLKFLRPDRVISMHAPKYGQDDELGALLRATVTTIASDIQVRREIAERS